MTRSPIRVREYRQCVVAGACTKPDLHTLACQDRSLPRGEGATYEGGDGEWPVTCVTPAQARSYCRWQGGTLPTAEQFLYGARGSAVRRYAWGDADPTCAQHPSGALAKLDGACCSGDCAEGERSRLGRHPAGAGPFGAEDVLTTPAELLALSSPTVFAACAGSEGACLVTGGRPGAIDSFTWVPADNAGAHVPALPTYGFRCVLGEVSK